MAWYSSAPARRSVQVLSDLAMAGWTLLWVLVGRAAHHHVLERFAPAERLVESGDRINDGVQGADQRLSDLPLVGDLASGVLDGLLGVGDPVTETGRELLASGERLADTMWLAVTGLPVLTALLVWLPVRLHFAVRSAATAANLRRVDDPEALLALRGLATLPVGTLASIDRDPVAAWRRGDEEVVHELARAQARELGVQLPQRSRR
ncbi:hypothetical protein [Kytococcus sp. HMSC28H12]|uniref:hypothetical protein n=1 Tax=Kytococcus sp. HMSC28H12 TaxID=1581067 RepID=UPI0008A54F0B|nr:hypothetical protein [Kytococcus sp. HMSC28H12]OFS11692.1 hypothetical protein HMPREF3099_07690 [Kytococcus sp. HMSC28H12]